MMVLSVPFVVFLLPETKSIPLEEMDRLWAPEINTWNANKIVMAELQRERGNDGSAPEYLHPTKVAGEEKVEDVDQKSASSV